MSLVSMLEPSAVWYNVPVSMKQYHKAARELPKGESKAALAQKQPHGKGGTETLVFHVHRMGAIYAHER